MNCAHVVVVVMDGDNIAARWMTLWCFFGGVTRLGVTSNKKNAADLHNYIDLCPRPMILHVSKLDAMAANRQIY